LTESSGAGRGVAIGIDAGGSKTDAVLVDAGGVELARASAGGANLRSSGRHAAEASLSSVISALLGGHHVRAICVGAAGAGREADRDELYELLKRVAPPRILLIVMHDGEIALRTATSARPAMVVIAGTGSLAYGERADGTSDRAGGYGALIGDPGSGYAIGLDAITHTARALEGVEPTGSLVTEISRALQVSSANDLIEGVAQPLHGSPEWAARSARVAALAAYVATADRAGDAAARQILARHERLLGALAARVARDVRDGDAALPVALCGGAYDAVPTLVAAVTQAVGGTGPCAIIRLERSPAVGAALIALERLRADGAL
jgi:N-acetylglucosamine kinase-like BadF-type ATPase